MKRKKKSINKYFYWCIAFFGMILLTMIFSCRSVDDFIKIADTLPLLAAAAVFAMKCFVDKNKDGMPDFLEKEDKEHE